MTLRAVIYARISADRDGTAIGVDRQRRECLALVAERGWTEAVSLPPDNDVSAYSGRPRPNYARLLELVRARAVDVIVAWHPDRLHRSPVELEEFISLVEQHGVRVETVQAGLWDLSTPGGRLVARQLGSVARYESEHKSARVRSALQQNAEAGTPHGRTAYGWRRGGTRGARTDVIEPTEADVVRRIARQIIAGESIRQITNRLNADDIPSPTGREWRKGMVRHVVLRERNAGLRRYQGQILGEASWDPILPRGTWEQVCAILADPRRRTSTGSRAMHLLSGIARCGACGGAISAWTNRDIPSYRCAVHCCVSRRRLDVDGFVTAAVIDALTEMDSTSVWGTPAPAALAAEEARELQERLDRAADQYAAAEIDARQLARITAALRPQIASAQARARIVDDSPLLSDLIGPDAERLWEGTSLSRRRAVVDLLMSVRIHPGRRGTKTFDPNLIEITWKPSDDDGME